MEPTDPIFTTPTGRAYRIGDGISSAEVEHKETVIVIDRVDEGDVWYTLPSVPEQEAVKIDRTAFERYLDTGYFSVVEQAQERTIQAEPRDPASGVPFKVGDIRRWFIMIYTAPLVSNLRGDFLCPERRLIC